MLGTAANAMPDWGKSLGTPLFKVEGSNEHALNDLYCLDRSAVTSAGSPYVKVDEAGRRILPFASFVKLGCFAPAPWELHNEHGRHYVSTCVGKVTPLDAEGWKPCGQGSGPIVLTSLLVGGSGFSS